MKKLFIFSLVLILLSSFVFGALYDGEYPPEANWFKFDETTTPVVVDSSLHQNGTTINMENGDFSTSMLNAGNSLTFDGVDEEVIFYCNADWKNITWTFFYNTTTPQTALKQCPIGVDSKHNQICILADGKIQTHISVGDNFDLTTVGTFYNNGSTFFVARRGNGTQQWLETFINGKSLENLTTGHHALGIGTVANMTIGKAIDWATATYYFNGSLENVIMFNNSLTFNEVYTMSGATGSDIIPPVITPISPINNSVFNINYTGFINWSTDELTNCSINNTNWILNSSNNTLFTYFNPTGIDDGKYTIKIHCNDSAINNRTYDLMFRQDSINPIMYYKNTTLKNADATYTFNINGSDLNLEVFMINCTNSTGDNVHTNRTVNITTTTWNYTRTVNTWGVGLSWCNVTFCDEHTDNEISINPKKHDNDIEIIDGVWLIANDNNIILDSIELKPTKAEYKYTFKKPTQNTQFILNSDWYAVYGSKYKGHIVHPFYNLWTDFVSDETDSVKITKFGDNLLIDVHFDKLIENVEFKSTGGLNCITNNLTVLVNTPPTTPANLTPLNNTNISASSWPLFFNSTDIDGHNITYYVYVGKDTTDLSLYTKTNSNVTVLTDIHTGQTIYWLVQASDTYDNSSNSTRQQFFAKFTSGGGGGGGSTDYEDFTEDEVLKNRICSTSWERTKISWERVFDDKWPDFRETAQFVENFFDFTICNFKLMIVGTPQSD
jgi:hypothetical protein